jgi:hypothetical protein
MKRPNIKFLLIFVFTVLLTLLYQYETILTYFDSVNIPATEKMCQNVPVKIKLKLNNKNFTITNNSKNSTNRVAIIIPYRNRAQNLKLFLTYMHQYLHEQANLNYAIFLVEPIKQLIFNRALLINIGFMEVIKQDWNCFIFHDIDMLPENPANKYECNPLMPKQMATSISVFNYSTDATR